MSKFTPPDQEVAKVHDFSWALVDLKKFWHTHWEKDICGPVSGARAFEVEKMFYLFLNFEIKYCRKDHLVFVFY